MDGDVAINDKGLTKLPLKFRNVTGHFSCSSNQLTTLEGAPTSVGGSVDCSNNQLLSDKKISAYKAKLRKSNETVTRRDRLIESVNSYLSEPLI